MKFQIIKAIFMLSNVPFSWFLLWVGAPLYSVFYVMAAIELLYIATLVVIGRNELRLPAISFVKNVAIPVLRAVVILVIFVLICGNFLQTSSMPAIKIIAITLILFIIGSAISAVTILSLSQRNMIASIVLTKLHIKRS